MANLQRDLEAAVFDEGRVVTYLTLCREKRVTAEEAKRALAHFVEGQGQAVYATHLVSGVLDGVFTLQVADESSAKELKDKMAPGASSHVYSVSAGQLKDAVARLTSAITAQATALGGDSGPSGEYYRNNRSSRVHCATVEHAHGAAIAGKSVTMAVPHTKPVAGSEAPSVLKKATTANQSAGVSSLFTHGESKLTAPSDAHHTTSSIVPPPTKSATSAVKGKKGGLTKSASVGSAGSGMFNRFKGATASDANSLPSSSAVKSPVASSPAKPPSRSKTVLSDADLDSESEAEDDAEFGADLEPPNYADLVRAAEEKVAAKQAALRGPPHQTHVSTIASPELRSASPVVDVVPSVEEVQDVDMTPEPVSHPSVTAVGATPGKIKKKVLVEKTFENEEGFLVTEHVWEETEVDAPPPAAAPATAHKPAPTHTAVKKSTTADKKVPDKDPEGSEGKKTGTKRKGKAEPAGGPKQASMTSFFSRK